MPGMKLSKMPAKIEAAVMRRLQSAKLEENLVSFAVRRIEAGGDSEFKYPELWKHPKSFRFLTGGEPLKDTGQHILNTLFGIQQIRKRGTLTITLGGSLIALYHQHGFKTKGPNFIPLTKKAARIHVNGANPEEEGLVKGEDYIIAWKGVTVPQRKIFNMPIEDVEDLREAIVDALTR